MNNMYPSDVLTESPALPIFWTQAVPGGLATNPDPLTGGIIDQAIVDSKWFVIFNRDDIQRVEGLENREEAFRVFSEKLSEAICKPNEFNDADRYTVPVESKLILFLPVTSFRPEAMRVSERTSQNAKWFEVEIFRNSTSKWIDQKQHDNVDDATNDAIGWYPDPNESVK